MLTRMILISAVLCPLSSAAVRSGKATVDWISSSGTCEPGKPVQTAIRMVLDEGWHSYWLNPGEAGIRTTVEWKLPPGWQSGGLTHPVPSRFVSGGLAGFGYKGTVLFPVTLTPPAGFKGSARLLGRISWLTCNDSGCVPGEAELSLTLESGAPEPAADAPAIHDALLKVPRPHEGTVHLKVIEKPDSLVLVLVAEPTKALDFDKYEVFPATLEVIDAAAEIRFAPDGASWKAEVPKCEYAKSPVTRLTLVLAGNAAQDPIELTWQAR